VEPVVVVVVVVDVVPVPVLVLATDPDEAELFDLDADLFAELELFADDFVFFVLVDVESEDVDVPVSGGATDTVLDDDVGVHAGLKFRLLQRGSMGAELASLLEPDELPPPVSVPFPLPVASVEVLTSVVFAEPWQPLVPTMGQMTLAMLGPMPVASDDESAGPTWAAARPAAAGDADVPDPPTASTAIGTAATIPSGTQRRTRARRRAARSCCSTTLPPTQGGLAPRPARPRAAVHMFAPWTSRCQRGRPRGRRADPAERRDPAAWQGHPVRRLDVARTRNWVGSWGF